MGDQPDRNSPHYANRNDVEFDDATSDALASACRNAARDLRDKVPGQRTKADTAMVEFKGTSQNSMTITSTLPLIMVKILPLFLTSLPKW